MEEMKQAFDIKEDFGIIDIYEFKNKTDFDSFQGTRK
jgi:hypothetical protein